MEAALTDFIAGLPKAELHLHIEGTLTPALRRKFAERNKLSLGDKSFAPLDVSANGPAPAAEPTSALQLNINHYKMFLELYFEGLKVLRTEEDFHDLAYAYLAACKRDNVRYAELSFDPQAHTDRGIPFGIVVEGLASACHEAAKELGVRSNLIMCINRDLPAESAMKMMKDAQPYREHIMGLGLDSVEEGHPPVKFQEAYDLARAEGYRLTAHCDVDMVDAVKHLWQCIDKLGVERIDHGINTIEDDRLVAAMIERDICLTACPTWRTGDPAPRRVDRIRKMYELGLKVTLNTDDPGYFISGLMNNMLPPVAATGRFTKAELGDFMINAFDAAWLPRATRDGYIAEVKGYVASATAAA